MAATQGDRSMALSAWSALRSRRARHGPEPLVTYLDMGSGSASMRTELSAISVENAVAKLANALRDEFDLEPGSSIGLHLPWHWQRSVWWGGCTAIGAGIVPDGRPDEVDLVACTLSGIDESLRAGDPDRPVLVITEHPLGLPITQPLPAGFVDAATIIRAQPDLFMPPSPLPQVLVPAAGDLPCAIEPGQRILVACRVDQPNASGSWDWPLAIPLATEASLVMVAIGDQPVDLDGLAAQERADAILVLTMADRQGPPG